MNLEPILAKLVKLEQSRNHMMSQKTDLAVEMGQLMRQIRIQKRLSLRQAAKLLGISAPYLSDMERGKRMPSAKFIQATEDLEP